MLSNRFHVMKDDKINAQCELLNLKDKNEIYLQQEITQRTKKITDINKELIEVATEKELLLKEVCHRVKNNFQMVIGMLSIEANKDKNEQHRNSFIELTNRIKSMSYIHQYIYDSNKISNIESKSYILKLIDETIRMYDKRTTHINANIDECVLSMNEALAIGVIVSEILSNSIKHHNTKNRCIIDVNFNASNGHIILSLQDNGLGFSPELKNSSEGLGIKLIYQFARKLKNSKIEYIFKNGTKFVLSFELDSHNSIESKTLPRCPSQ